MAGGGGRRGRRFAVVYDHELAAPPPEFEVPRSPVSSGLKDIFLELHLALVTFPCGGPNAYDGRAG